ncbi:MAG: helix-turn-helix domain-containing protein [Proteobacteria bacterium]|nr:helix-turn-helix domain-containing protein [Pseudomonadota bacterium]
MDIERNQDELWVLFERYFQRALRSGESQDSLAKKIGVSQGSISKWLDGQRRDHVQLVSVLRIIEAFQIDPAKVFDVLFARDGLSGIEQLRQERDQAVKTLARVRKALDESPAL